MARTAEHNYLLDISVERDPELPNKYDEAKAQAERFPEIAAWLPRERRFFDNEPRNIILFDALTLAESVLNGPTHSSHGYHNAGIQSGFSLTRCNAKLQPIYILREGIFMSGMRSYGAARGLFSFLAFVAWSMIVIGIIAAVLVVGESSSRAPRMMIVIFLISSLALSVFGLFLLAAIQNGRATVDTAEYTQQMLKIARDQLEVSNQALKQGYETAASFSTQAEPESTKQANGYTSKEQPPKPELKSEVTKSIDYKGESIQKLASGYQYKGASFRSLDAVRTYVDEQIEPKRRKMLPHD